MNTRFALVSLSLLVMLSAGLGFAAAKSLLAEPDSQEIAKQVIARERAAVEAWRRKDKAFFAALLSDDATYFSPQSPYLDGDPKANFLPKFEQYAEMFKYTDFQMYNPRVQVYGEVAILTYNHMVAASFGGQPLNYTGKATVVYVKQGGAWRVVHGHESMNPGPRP